MGYTSYVCYECYVNQSIILGFCPPDSRNPQNPYNPYIAHFFLEII